MKNYSTHLIISFCLLFEGIVAQAQLRDKLEELEVTATAHVGFVRPEKIIPASERAPIGGEITIGSLKTTEKAWQLCNCFHRSGWYANYYNFRNPYGLGETFGTGFYFEPLLLHRPDYNLSVRFTMGLSYVNRLYHPVRNPNRNFSSHINGMTGIGVYGRKRISERLELVGMLALDYRHISNAGIRNPNQGINIPSIVAGIAYGPPTARLPESRWWRPASLDKRWFGRALLLTSVRVYAADDQYPETPRAMVGVNAYAGYRFTQSHALSTGIEIIDDGYMREQMMRQNYKGTTQQATWLVGYELWQGRVSFTAHFGWNFLRPGTVIFGRRGYRPATYEKYGLLYRFNNGLTAGVIVKAFGEDTKGFQLAVGGNF
ncbi:acyloxyacyl hydrolase [Runella limosa]|uniref:acyloxyacyl hydrolase n=1 Tax=Runella limosa TaxID=370978 RepID=UPI000400832E|nr:acyloxyacyl hydrolase [Runella limosa]